MLKAQDYILMNWGDLSTRMDIARMLKKYNLLGFNGQPLSLHDMNDLFYYMDEIPNEVLSENGWI